MQQLQNLFVSFISALLVKNPKWADYIQVLSVIVAIGTAVDHALVENHVALPHWATLLDNGFIAAGAVITAILAQLPNVKKAGA